MSKIRSLIQQIHIQGASGLYGLLKANLSRVDTCVRLEQELIDWEEPERHPCPEEFELRHLSTHEFEAARASSPVTLPQDFYEDQVHGLADAIRRKNLMPMDAEASPHWFKLGSGGCVQTAPQNHERILVPGVDWFHRSLWPRTLKLLGKAPKPREPLTGSLRSCLAA